MTLFLFYPDGDDASTARWRDAFLAEDPDMDFRVWPDWGSVKDGPAYCFVWQASEGILRDQTNIKAIFSMGAGVDGVLRDSSIPEDLPVYRLTDDNLAKDMADYMTMATLMMHRRMPQLLAQQREGTWKRRWNKKASEVRVGIMGYGTLGRAVSDQLAPIGYQLSGWSRTAKPASPGINLHHGNDGLHAFLEGCDILLCLLPHTSETTGLLNTERLSWLPEGAAIVNGGRGSLIDLDALQTALDGPLGAAMLDVMPEEPFPSDHPVWKRHDVILTPHIAALTRQDSAAQYVVEAIAALENGGGAPAQLKRDRGY